MPEKVSKTEKNSCQVAQSRLFRHVACRTRGGCLFEDLNILDGHGTIRLNELAFLVKEVLNESLVGGVVDVSLAPSVGVDVLAHLGLELRGTLSAADQEHGVDFRVVVLAEDDDDTEGILAGRLETLDETTSQVGGHEELGEILVVEVVSEPDGPAFGLVVLPEPGDGDSTEVLGVVGVDTLPLFQVELSGREEIQGVGGLLGRLLFILFVITSGGSGRGGLGSLDGLGLNRLRLVHEGLSAEGEGTSNGDKVGLTHNGGEPAHHVAVGLAELGIHELAEGRVQHAREDDISQGDGLANEVSAGQQIVVQGGEQLVQISLSSLSSGSVELEVAEDGIEPDTNRGRDLLGPVNPGINDRGLIRGRSVQDTSLAGDVLGNGIALPDGTIRGLQSGDLGHDEGKERDDESKNKEQVPVSLPSRSFYVFWALTHVWHNCTSNPRYDVASDE